MLHVKCVCWVEHTSKDSWWVLVLTVMNLGVSLNVGNLLIF
jgi:hypothetical protein